ncbi:hypothetical protein COW36_08865 [bacterium (Candidatus Blackallbacteria) CG17_big_fil_post_rev_8_21_14_2_50_48_46]|uniref:Alpha/beta hydrolase n=1 Tax=bacterium (Candidatus Blackallbacteria) CG17_big_fil_post_rev_8_21_14_2_50_48_46 TaxID=2014261 RepID=A0A2M7G7C5_9BACT|nr:MAG: hypothetical protein COW64_06165 [bacterium (Candidatus Blackallbacteria) CG18_big_fil_WC_8_21_14_2_50_49_26]PIW17596.1 MAG: hypothetical protein COW36_08865 [bacterium (Candidatus Blackallbacteria) CG17_big_fil_post_rev_8_21_14_2_50_48_46]PIW48451.1 MAG: hypothetical protein COW20_10215 [bacterium (Candidatus Blackallbacteria) CG13_big_fil_rev_8_21_14_2_50_49_14]
MQNPGIPKPGGWELKPLSEMLPSLRAPLKPPAQFSPTLHSVSDQLQNLSPLSSGLDQFAFLEDAAQIQAEAEVRPESYQALQTLPGKHWLGKMPANGNREVAVMIPQGTDLSRPVELVYFFHGHNGTIAKSLADPQKGLGSEITHMAQEGRNRVWVIPQGPPKERDFSWMNPLNKESMTEFQTQTLAELQQLAPGLIIGQTTVKGHSAGGLPLMNGAAHGMQADRIEFLDASYGSWASETWRKQKQTNPALEMRVVYIPGTSTEANALSLRSQKGVKLIISKVSHGAVPKTHIKD